MSAKHQLRGLVVWDR